MIRIIFFLAKLCLLVGLVVFVADHTGRLSFEWQDSLVEMPAILAFVIILFCIWLAFQLARLVTALRTTPRLYRMHTRLRSVRQGQKYLGQALEAFSAQKKSRGIGFLHRAEKLLGTSDVLDYVKAQAGVPLIESSIVTENVSDHSSPFAWRQAIETHLREGRLEQAHQAAQNFSAQYPHLPLSKKLHFDIAVRRSQWDEAMQCLEELHSSTSLSRKEWRAAKAAVITERARQSLARGHAAEAFDLAMQADRLVPHWVPALEIAARALANQNKQREAAALIEKAWARSAHEQLGDVYLSLRVHKSDLHKAEAVERMIRDGRATFASRMLLARSFAKARLWGQARHTLHEVIEENPHHDAFELMAHIEESEKGDKDTAAEWRRKGHAMPPDDAWVCSACRQPHPHWQVLCASCQAFNTLAWGTPLHKGKIEKPAQGSQGSEGHDRKNIFAKWFAA